MGLLDVLSSGDFPRECLITELAPEVLSHLVFLLHMPLEVTLGGELLTTHPADLSLAEVLGLDVDLQVVAGGKLATTDLADQVRPVPGVFGPLVIPQDSLAPTLVVTVMLRTGEGLVTVVPQVCLPSVVLPTVSLVTPELLPSVDLEMSDQADLLRGFVVTNSTMELSLPNFLLLLLYPLPCLLLFH